ncbi:MAG: BcsE family c-di-GMP-binding protein [Succinivibrio sp.]
MYLGITKLVTQLQNLQENCLYVVTTPDRRSAINFGLHCLYKNREKGLLKFLTLDGISPEDIRNDFANPDLLPKILTHVYCSKGEGNLLRRLAADYNFVYQNDGDMSLFVSLINDRDVAELNDSELDTALTELSELAKRKGICLLLVTYGINQISCNSRFLRASTALSGLASVENTHNDTYLSTMMWRFSDGSFSRGDNHLNLTEDGYEVVFEDNTSDVSVDNLTCYVLAGDFTPDRSLFTDIRTFSSNRAIYESAIKEATSATIFFSITKRDEIDEVAEYLYDLRTERGKNLKLMILECIQGMRSSSEHFLLDCGATFIFEANAKSSYINAVLPTLKDLKFNHYIRTSFEDISTRYHLIENEKNGYLKPDEFIKKVRFLVTASDSANSEGTLAKLTCSSDFTPAMCISQFKPKRGGDYCTVIDGCIYAFMPSCRNGELSITLSHIFNVGPEKLFSRCRALYTRSEIIVAIDNLKAIESDESSSLLIEQIARENAQRNSLRLKHKKLSDLACTESISAKPIDSKLLEE